MGRFKNSCKRRSNENLKCLQCFYFGSTFPKLDDNIAVVALEKQDKVPNNMYNDPSNLKEKQKAPLTSSGQRCMLMTW